MAATETTPRALEDRLFDELFGRPVDGARVQLQYDRPSGGVAYPQLVVLERFALRGELMAQQQGSEFLTSQLIGSVRCLCRLSGTPVVIQTPQQHKAVLKRGPWSDWPLRRFKSYGHGPHAKSAELHGIFYILSVLRQPGRARELADWTAQQSGPATGT